MSNEFDKQTVFRATYDNEELKKVRVRYRKETSSGYVWIEEALFPNIDIIEIKEEETNGKKTISIKANGELEKIIQ